MKKPRLLLKDFYQGLNQTPLDEIYRQRVLSTRVRRVELPGMVAGLSRRYAGQVQKTLLGFEVQRGDHRKNVPDLATARYIKIFSALGLTQVMTPYNPIETAELLPALEASFSEINRKLADLASPATERRRYRYFVRRVARFLAQRIRQAENERPTQLVNRPDE